MWTPKRVLLLSAGLLVFFAGYLVYAFFLGRIDGMAPLPPEFIGDGGTSTPEPLPESSEIERKLIQAFGPGCPQLKKDLKVEIRKKDMVVAADKAYFNEPDGRVRLTEFSVAIFKHAPAGVWPEISTITSDEAYLTFDKPIKDATEVANAKIMGAELVGNITIINNQKTQKTSDDLEVIIGDDFGRKQGKLFYDEPTGRIWTEQFVQLLDKKTQPDPTKITGLGMDMLLAKEQPEDKKKAKNPNAGSDFSGVEQIVLKKRVEMDLYPDANSGIMTDGAPLPQTAKQQPPEKSHVKIKTEGRFVYDMRKDTARFSSPEDEKSTDRVIVMRWLLSEESKQPLNISIDQMVCNVLTLKFVHKSDTPAPPKTAKSDAEPDKSGSDREIESAHATARRGETVTVAMDSQNMHCECQELDYQCPTPDRGARTVLRGTPAIPVDACKDSHRILTLEMVLVGADSTRANQHMFAQGPGKVDLYDKKTDSYHSHAIFKGQLTQIKIKEGQRELDLLTLTEDAAFIEDDTRGTDGQIKPGQKLFGQILKVWLAAAEPAPKTADAKPAAQDEGPRQKPVRLEAFDRVRLEGSQFRIQECDHLIVRFTDVAPAPAAPAQITGLPYGSAPSQPPLPGQIPSPPSPSPSPSPSPPKANNAPPEKSKPPIDVWARDVSADVRRSGETNDLDKFVAVGKVHVHQNGATPADKGVDIKGETLKLEHFKDGDKLTVFADQKKEQDCYAEVQLGKIYLVGKHVVKINQVDNTVAIDGIGAMSMPSNAAMGSATETKPGGVLTVHWTRDMLFDGTDALFSGNVVALQNDSTMQCQSLQVELEPRVSLKEGQKDDQPAKVKTMIANNGAGAPVVARDEPKDRTVPVTRMQQLVAQTIVVNTLEDTKKQNTVRTASPGPMSMQKTDPGGDQFKGDINARGPGTMTIVQRGSPDGSNTTTNSPPANAPKQAKQPAKEPELMRTNIDFRERLFSTQLDDGKTRKSKFTGNILVVYAPGDNLDVGVDMAKLPKGGMVLQCETLTVVSREHTVIDPKTRQPKTVQSQSMLAEQRVQCWTPELFIQADTAVFDDVQDTITFRGKDGNLARVARRVGPQGSQPQWTTGTTIVYNRKNASINVEGSTGFTGEIAHVNPVVASR